MFGSKKKTNVFKTFLISYIIILLVPIAVLSIVYNNLFGDYQDMVYEAAKSNIRQVELISDQNLDIITKISQNISLNEDTPIISRMKHPFNFEEVKFVRRYMETVSNSIPRDNPLILDYYVYLPESGYVFSKFDFVKDNIFYPHYYKYDNMSFNEWKAMLDNRSNVFVYEDREIVLSGRESGEDLVLVMDLPVLGTEAEFFKVVLHLNKRYLSSIMYDESSQFIYIRDVDGNIVFYSDPLVSKIAYAAEKDYYSFTEKSVVVGWEYVALISKNMVENKVIMPRMIFVAAIVLVILLGIYIGYYFSKRNYKPINDMVRLFNDDNEDNNNEFEYIRSNISGVISEKENLKTEIGRHLPVIKNEIYLGLLQGNTVIDKEISDEFNHERFVVILAEIDFRDGFSISLYNYIFESFVSLKEGGEWYVSLKNNRVCVIIGDNDVISTKVQNVILRMQNALSVTNLKTTFAISDEIHELKNLPDAYMKINKAIGHKLIKGVGSIIHADEAEDKNTEKYYYPIAKENEFINSIKISDTKASADILNQIIIENFENRNLSIDTANLVVFKIISSINTALSSLKIDSSKLFSENPVVRLNKCESVYEIKECVTDILGRLDEYLRKNAHDQNVELKEKIIRYIHKNYNDSNISLTTIADKLDINSSYLSRYFKGQFDENFIDYISKYRISISKELMKDKTLQIQTIAIMIGYISANNFIRVFKKYEGISPNKYREENIDV